MITYRRLMWLSGALLVLGLSCLAQAQVPMTGAGKGTIGGGGGSLAIDAVAFLPGNNCTASGTSATFTNALNIGSGGSTSNLALGVGLILGGAAPGTSSGISMTWNSASMGSSVYGPDTGGGNGDIYWFGLTAPATGTHDIVANWTGANGAYIVAISVSGANQTGGTTTFANHVTSTSSGDPASRSITNASGKIAVAAYEVLTAFSGTLVGTDIGHGNNCAASAGAGNYSTATNPTLSYSNSGNNWVASGISIQ